MAGGRVELVEQASLPLPALRQIAAKLAQQICEGVAAQVSVVSRQQGLERLLAHLLGQKASLGRLAASLQQPRRPEVILRLKQPKSGAMAGALQAHGKRQPASSGTASARTARQKGVSPWRTRTSGRTTSGCSGSEQPHSASNTAS